MVVVEEEHWVVVKSTKYNKIKKNDELFLVVWSSPLLSIKKKKK